MPEAERLSGSDVSKVEDVGSGDGAGTGLGHLLLEARGWVREPFQGWEEGPAGH